MKRPRPRKKLKYPELWYQPCLGGGRLRILYPDGRAEYYTAFSHYYRGIWKAGWMPSCYALAESPSRDVRQQMKKYDGGDKRAIFLGEVK